MVIFSKAIADFILGHTARAMVELSRRSGASNIARAGGLGSRSWTPRSLAPAWERVRAAEPYIQRPDRLPTCPSTVTLRP
ncbi:MAG: hypothetical protein GDA56_21705 [Hormoscilla sp. GM7CHS1pb]|nr:hypothetical protein [Hormoscilla sp. GM7CHS1pb]